MVRGGDREMVGAARVLEISCKVVLLVKFSDAKMSDELIFGARALITPPAPHAHT